MSDIGDELGEELRRRALRYAVVISRHSGDWSGTVGWLLRTLPCVETHCTHEPSQLSASATRVLWQDPDAPDHSPLYLYVDEPKDSGNIGPVARKIRCAWTAVTYRFDWRHHEKFYDFGIDDAKRIALLSALTLCRDFDGADLGLSTESGPGWPWSAPDQDKWRLEGRHWTWSMTPTQGTPGRDLLQLMTLADEYLSPRYGVPEGAYGGTRSATGVAVSGTIVQQRVEVNVLPAQPTVQVNVPPAQPIIHVGGPTGSRGEEATPVRGGTEQLRPSDRAIALLVKHHRDGKLPSIRDLALQVDTSHTTLLRDKQFMAVYTKFGREHEREATGRLRHGNKDPETGEVVTKADDEESRE